MFLPTERFGFCAAIESHYPTFRREAGRLEPAEYLPWPDRGAYRGSWRVFPIFFARPPGGMAVDEARHQARCPESSRVLRSMPGIVGAGFSLLEPGTHILPHVDAKDGLTLRCHLGIRVYAGSRVRVGDAIGAWEDGKCLLFDGFVEHEAANEGVEPRVVLLADFTIDPALADEFGILRAPCGTAAGEGSRA